MGIYRPQPRRARTVGPVSTPPSLCRPLESTPSWWSSRLTGPIPAGGGTSFSILRTMQAAYEVSQLSGMPLSPSGALYLATRGGAHALDLDERFVRPPRFELAGTSSSCSALR